MINFYSVEYMKIKYLKTGSIWLCMRFFMASVLSQVLFQWNKLNFNYSKLDTLNIFEKKVYSQNGEDGIIEHIFDIIGTETKYFVEFGVEDGFECNTRLLSKKRGWRGLLMDGDGGSNNIQREFVSPKNINKLFAKYNVPKEFDLLSIDIDSLDYYVWEAIKPIYKPRVVFVEYNSSIAPDLSLVVENEENFTWDETNYFGASLAALRKLGLKKGYTLVACDKNGVNSFFVQTSILKSLRLSPLSYDVIYFPPGYGMLKNGVRIGHRLSQRQMKQL